MTLSARDPQRDDSYECPECGSDVHFNDGPMGLGRSQASCAAACGYGLSWTGEPQRYDTRAEEAADRDDMLRSSAGEW